MPQIANTDLSVHPLCLGTNILGWTADRDQSFAVLDRYAAAGGNFLDTADVYSQWVDGHSGGEAEALIGEWMAARGNRDDVVIATKVGMKAGLDDLRPDTIRRAAEESLARLQTDRIDLYYAHEDDPDTPLEDTLAAFGELVREGKVRHVAASNYSAPRLTEALDLAEREGLARYVALQPEYNLMDRDGFEDGLRDVCRDRDLPVIPYFSLAKGFLSGKYRPGDTEDVDSKRSGQATGYLEDGRAEPVLEALDEVSAAHDDAPIPAVALAWLAAQDTVATPIASARTIEQVDGLVALDGLDLSNEEIDRLEKASL